MKTTIDVVHGIHGGTPPIVPPKYAPVNINPEARNYVKLGRDDK